MNKEVLLKTAASEKAFTFSDAVLPSGTVVAVGFYPTKLMINTANGWVYTTEELGQQMVDIIFIEKYGYLYAFGKGPDIYNSIDGNVWNKQAGPNVNWRNVCVRQADGLIVGITDSTVISSADMIVFNESAAPTPPSAIGFVKSLELFILAGYTVNEDKYPILFTSTDAVTWTEVLT